MAFGRALLAAFVLAVSAGAGHSANQTPTVSDISLDEGALPYVVTLERVKVPTTLPTLQSFAVGQHAGQWVIIGGRTNGLHKFTNKPLKNFPPSAQNRRIWVIDPATWQSWSRPLRDSTLSRLEQDELSATATESVQVGSTLYVVGGYGFSKTIGDFTTFTSLTAFDLPEIIAWVKGETTKDLQRLIRRTRNKTLKVTGGQLTMLNGRATLVFGQDFEGGYGSVDHVQTYTGQVRSFRIVDNGNKIAIADIREHPIVPNLDDYRRRDYNLLPILEDGKDAAVALSGVFTLTNGVWTVPVEIDGKGRPSMADPDDPKTFKQGMNNYDTANVVLYDTRNEANHILLFGGISYETYKPNKGFVPDSNIPFTNQATAVVRKANGKYEQTLLQSAEYPRVKDKSGARLMFGAEAPLILDPATPTIGNGLVDLRAALKKGGGRIGWIFGGIAAEQPNSGPTAASNEVFEVILSKP